MGLSGRRPRACTALLTAALAITAVACGGDDDDDYVRSLASVAAEPTTVELDVAMGAAIDASQAAFFVPLVHDERQVQPVAMYGTRVLVSETQLDPERMGEPQRFVLLDPVSGERTPAWESEPGLQDIVTGIDGDTAVFVRTGTVLPFEEWSIHAQDLLSGDERVIATAEEGVAAAEGVRPGAPFGFAPYPDVQGGRLAWVEYVLRDGAAFREVRVHDLETGETRTVASAESALGGDLSFATIGGVRAAWVRWMPDGSAAMELFDFGTGETRTIDVGAKPFALALDGSGETLAWDDTRGGKYVLNLAGGTPSRFGSDEGWGVTGSGSRFSWAPASAYGGTAGFYDTTTNELRLVEQDAGVQVNYAAVLGEWFTWQELRANSEGRADMAASGYYFLPPGS